MEKLFIEIKGGRARFQIEILSDSVILFHMSFQIKHFFIDENKKKKIPGQNTERTFKKIISLLL